MPITLSKWPQRRRPNTIGARTAPKPFLSDFQWDLIKDLYENPDPSPLGGRPPRTQEGVSARWTFTPTLQASLESGSHQ
ncbi:MAG: hypothetical protein R3C18_26205 [Planctomycetaceae bacterium]